MRQRSRFLLSLALVAALLTSAACGDDGGGDDGNNAVNNDTNNDTPNNDPNNDTPNNDVNNDAPTGLPSGLFAMGISVAPLNGLVLPFQVELTSTTNEDGSGSFDTLSLRAVDDDGETTSDVLGTAENIAVASDGTYTLSFTGMVLPGRFTPTGSDVELNITLNGQVNSSTEFCGTLSGLIVTFDIDLAGSTFGAVAWEGRPDEFPGACPGDGPADIPRIEDCPAVTTGRNTGFPSAGEGGREFEVFAPADAGDRTDMALIFVYHGFGGDIESMTDGAEFGARADELGAVIVVPQGRDVGGTPGWNVTVAESEDIAFFDDMVKCVGESFSIDEDRLHVTGMSNGGLMTGTLVAARNELLASVAPMSGGLFFDYPAPFDNKIPGLIIWGGEADEAFDTDFHLLSNNLMADFEGNDQFFIPCNHGQGHEYLNSYYDFIFQFFMDHPRGVAPEPYADALPEVFPDFCQLP